MPEDEVSRDCTHDASEAEPAGAVVDARDAGPGSVVDDAGTGPVEADEPAPESGAEGGRDAAGGEATGTDADGGGTDADGGGTEGNGGGGTDGDGGGADGNGGGGTEGGGDGERDAPGTGGSIQWLFLLGLLVFVAGLVAFVADLATGHDVVRSLVANAVGAVLLVSWAGLDSYRDPDSGVTSIGGTVGTGLILVGLYLLGAGVVVAATSLVHDRLMVGVAMVAGGIPLVLGGFVAYPIAGLPAGGDDSARGDHPDDGDGA
jgi:hypothetical protein